MTGPRIALLATVVSVVLLTAAWAQLPPGAQTGPGGVRAELTVPDAAGGSWRVRAYRPKRPSSSPMHIPGAIDLCMAVDKGGRRWNTVVCSLTAPIGLQLLRHGLWIDCGGLAYIVGEPAPPAPRCGLVPADVVAVTVTADGQPPQAAALSEPFSIRVNHGKRVLERSGVDPERVRSLPPAITMRAFLGFVNTPPTQPGERTPKITITATRAGGESVSRTIASHLLPKEAPQRPGARRAHLSARGPDGRVWRTTSWRNSSREVCTHLRVGGKRRTSSVAVGCADWRGLGGELASAGSFVNTDSGPRAAAGYATYGFARGDAVAVDVVDWRGRVGSARLSRPWTSVPRAGRAVRLRSYLAVLPGKGPIPAPPLHDWVEVRTKLADGRVLTSRFTP